MAKHKGHGPRPHSISTPHKYRLLIHQPGRDTPLHFTTSDKARARHVARHHASGGAHVDFQTHQNWDVYTTTHTYTPETPT